MILDGIRTGGHSYTRKSLAGDYRMLTHSESNNLPVAIMASEMGCGERILIVEDDEAIAQGIEYQLASEGYRVHVSGNGEDALKSLSVFDPHLILLDIRLPDMSGFDVCRMIRAEGRNMPILILSALDGESDRVLGLELGADDFIAKPYKLREVVARIRSALRRSYGRLSARLVSPCIFFGDVSVDIHKHHVTKAGRIVLLTPAEFRLVELLTSNPEIVFSRSRLVQEIYGEPRALEVRTIDVHIHHLRSKLEDDQKKPRWFITVPGFGYKYHGTP